MLVVEDERLVRELTITTLRRKGYDGIASREWSGSAANR